MADGIGDEETLYSSVCVCVRAPETFFFRFLVLISVRG
jgi:hypothetical protein